MFCGSSVLVQIRLMYLLWLQDWLDMDIWGDGGGDEVVVSMYTDVKSVLCGRLLKTIRLVRS